MILHFLNDIEWIRKLIVWRVNQLVNWFWYQVYHALFWEPMLNRLASLMIRQVFLKPCLVNLILTLKAPIAIKVVCFSRLLKCLRNLYGKQCGPRSDCSYRSSLFLVHAVCLYTLFVSNVGHFFAAADDLSLWHFQMHFFLGALRVKRHRPSIHYICLQARQPS